MFAPYAKYGGWAQTCHELGVTRDLVDSNPLRQKAYQVLQELDAWSGSFYQFRQYWKTHQQEIEYLNSPTWPAYLPQKISEHRAFYSACCRGDLATVEWILAKWKSLFLGTGFKIACTHGQIDIANRLIQDTRFDDYMYDAGFENACRNGHLTLAKWIYGLCQPTVKMSLYFKVCQAGHLHVLQWFSTLDTVSNQCFNTYEISLNLACSSGHLDIVKWLVSEGANPNIDCCYPFRKACQAGHLHVAQWLLSGDLRFIPSFTLDVLFTQVCGEGHIKVAQFLKEKFPRIDVHALGNSPFADAIRDGHVEIAQWLKFNWPSVQYHGNMDCLFAEVCGDGHLQMAKWLISTYRDIDPLANNNNAYKLARNCPDSDTEMWLKENWPQCEARTRF